MEWILRANIFLGRLPCFVVPLLYLRLFSALDLARPAGLFDAYWIHNPERHWTKLPLLAGEKMKIVVKEH